MVDGGCAECGGVDDPDRLAQSWLFELVLATAEVVAPRKNNVAFDIDDVCTCVCDGVLELHLI
jgi:hypothetical protein